MGQLDVVVNNAGYGLSGGVEEVTEAQARAQFDTNFFGPLWVTQAVLPHMEPSGFPTDWGGSSMERATAIDDYDEVLAGESAGSRRGALTEHESGRSIARRRTSHRDRGASGATPAIAARQHGF